MWKQSSLTSKEFDLKRISGTAAQPFIWEFLFLRRIDSATEILGNLCGLFCFFVLDVIKNM